MLDYNYFEEMKKDVLDYITYDAPEIDSYDLLYNRDGLEEKLNEELWVNDSVTGNGSGSYTFNTYKAEEYICHNLDLLREACWEFGCDMGDAIEKGAEYCDVTIRCYLLGQVISEVLDDITDNLEKEEEEV